MGEFRYQLEKAKPRTGNGGVGGITRGASVHEFPASKGIAGVSMRLGPGSMRELHWHANAAEWAYVVSGSCRTTIVHPDGSAHIDTFDAGDVWYFPRGYGHSIQGLGPGECHFILIFDNGDFSEDHTFSITDFLAQTPTPIVAQNFGVTAADLSPLPKREAYFVQGPVPGDDSRESQPRARAQLVAQHRYPLMAQEPRRVPGGGTQRIVAVEDFPISHTMAGSVIELEPGAMREMHWHPNADEWQYYISGTAEMGVFLAEGKIVIEEFEAGDVGYAPMGAGHYIKNTGKDVCRVLLGFNNGHYQAIDMSSWLAGTPKDVLATTFGMTEENVAKMLGKGGFILRG